MRAVGGRSAVERGTTATPGSLVCSEDHQTGQAAWPVSTGLMATQARPWGRRDAARGPRGWEGLLLGSGCVWGVMKTFWS